MSKSKTFLKKISVIGAGAVVATMANVGAASAQETIKVAAIDGYSPKSLWVKEFIDYYIPEIDKRLAKTGNYEIEWNQAWGQIVKVRGVLGGLDKGLGDIGVVTTVFHADKVPLQLVAYATPFVTNDPGLVAKTVDDLANKHPQFKAAFTKFNQVYLTNLAVLVGRKIYEVAPYMLKADLGTANSKVISVNADSWKSYPEEVRNVMQEAAFDYRDRMASEALKLADASYKAFTENGGKITVLSQEQRQQWADNMPNVAADWAAARDKEGAPGTVVMKSYMDTMRAANQPILRQWDKELGS